jgi:hypothetical protein
VWESTVDGQKLTFHLAGINNQNFIMRDEETGSWWQQISGEALFGPLKGKRLTHVHDDQLTFEKWKAEKPNGLVLRPDEKFAESYASANWEERMQKTPVVTAASPDDPLPPRELIVGIELNGSKAYPFSVLQKQSPIVDVLNGTPIIIVLGDDKKSVRAFEQIIDSKTVELFQKPDSPQLTLVDPQTGSEFDFSGKAISGPLAGKQLKQIDILLDYWFDWKTYHPKTLIYRAGLNKS